MARRLLVGLAVGTATFVAAAIVLVILDLYLAGHGYPSPRNLPFLHRGPVQMSLADAIALSLAVVAGILAAARYGGHHVS